MNKKGRKPKSYYLNLLDISNNTNTNNNNDINNNINTKNNIDIDISNNVVKKKRGRKPKGGKIIEFKNIEINTLSNPNIILHLSCSLNDIKSNITYTPNINVINNYDIYENKNNKLNYDYIENKEDNKNFENNINDINDINGINDINDKNNINEINNNVKKNMINNNIEEINNISIHSKEIINKIDKKNIYKKIKDININFKLNKENINQNSCCFFCTCSFDNQPIFIPKYELNSAIECYGHFCSPECACGYLMNENIDTSNKFERYYLLNNIYGKALNYEKNIKPAPDPYYLLDKFYGTLTIEEYRKLLTEDKLILTLNKPITINLPELAEENNDFLLNNNTIYKKNF